MDFKIPKYYFSIDVFQNLLKEKEFCSAQQQIGKKIESFCLCKRMKQTKTFNFLEFETPKYYFKVKIWKIY